MEGRAGQAAPARALIAPAAS
ncbi:hypothetical protein BLAT2472_10243 [Burkholderia latens]